MILELKEQQKKIVDFSKNPSYNIVKLFEISGNLDIKRLRTAIDLSLNVMDVLKVNFISNEKETFLNYDANREMKLEVIKKENSETFSEDEVICIASDIANNPINFEIWPISNMKIYIGEENKYYLLMVAPHIISDIYSMYLLNNVIEKLYNSLLPDEQLYKLAEKLQTESYLHLKRTRKKDYGKYKQFFTEEYKGIDHFENREINVSRNNEGILKGEKTEVTLTETMTDTIYTFCKQKQFISFFLFSIFI